MYDPYSFSHMVISDSIEDGKQTETFRSLDEAEAFADRLAAEGHCTDIYITQMVRRVPCQLSEPYEGEDFGERPASARPPMRLEPLADRKCAA